MPGGALGPGVRDCEDPGGTDSNVTGAPIKRSSLDTDAEGATCWEMPGAVRGRDPGLQNHKTIHSCCWKPANRCGAGLRQLREGQSVGTEHDGARLEFRGSFRLALISLFLIYLSIFASVHLGGERYVHIFSGF